MLFRSKELNWWMAQNDVKTNPYNRYGGMDNLFEVIKFQPTYSICGHTHRRVETDYGCNVFHDDGKMYSPIVPKEVEL